MSSILRGWNDIQHKQKFIYDLHFKSKYIKYQGEQQSLVGYDTLFIV